MAGKTFAKAAAPKAAPKAPPAKPAKKEWVPKENDFGVFKNITSKKGNSFQAIEVLQDMTLQKGQLIVFQSLEDEMAFLTENNHISKEEAEQRLENLSWKIGSFRVLPPQG